MVNIDIVNLDIELAVLTFEFEFEGWPGFHFTATTILAQSAELHVFLQLPDYRGTRVRYFVHYCDVCCKEPSWFISDKCPMAIWWARYIIVEMGTDRGHTSLELSVST